MSVNYSQPSSFQFVTTDAARKRKRLNFSVVYPGLTSNQEGR
jgi:hypothetical protein